MTIHLLLGPMYAGKSSELIRRMRRFQHAGKSTFLIKHKHDIRYNTNNQKLSTHDQLKIECDYATDTKLMDDNNLSNKIKDVHVICIDEGQFFPDIDLFAEHYANLGKIIIIAALDSDFQRKPFNKIIELISKSEEYVKFTAVCNCGSDAAFTKRITNEKEHILIGGSDKYSAVCRVCYFKK